MGSIFVDSSKALSTHVPARGTTTVRSHMDTIQYFQPTSPQGGRQRHLNRRRTPLRLSTPVPARGTTAPQSCNPYRTHAFNPRPRKGDDSSPRPSPQSAASFNPRPRKGDDLRILFCKDYTPSFNPRPLKGDDAIGCDTPIPMVAFQPTSPQGGRQKKSLRETRNSYLSTHVPSRGTTLCLLSLLFA